MVSKDIITRKELINKYKGKEIKDYWEHDLSKPLACTPGERLVILEQGRNYVFGFHEDVYKKHTFFLRKIFDYDSFDITKYRGIIQSFNWNGREYYLDLDAWNFEIGLFSVIV